MAVYDLEEQEQLDELKTWWKQYGNLVTGAMLAIAVGLVAWQSWNWWQANQSTQAAALFAIVERAAQAQDAKQARDVAGELVDKFGGASHAAMAALISARVQVDAADTKTAKAQFSWVTDNAKDAEIRDLARMRLVALLIDEKSYDEALKHLGAEPSSPFAPRHAELRGDVLVIQGKTVEAKAAYQAALNKYDETQKSGPANQRQGQYRDVLLAKLESLAVPTAGSDATGDAKP